MFEGNTAPEASTVTTPQPPSGAVTEPEKSASSNTPPEPEWPSLTDRQNQIIALKAQRDKVAGSPHLWTSGDVRELEGLEKLEQQAKPKPDSAPSPDQTDSASPPTMDDFVKAMAKNRE